MIGGSVVADGWFVKLKQEKGWGILVTNVPMRHHTPRAHGTVHDGTLVSDRVWYYNDHM